MRDQKGSSVESPVSAPDHAPDHALDPFPELAVERDRLAFSRACRDAMIDRFSRVDPSASADELTKEYVEVTVAEALEDLRTPGAGEFFGRITEDAPAGRPRDTWYIGRRHIEDEVHEPVVVDWRAAIAAPFYRATGVDPLGLVHRRRFTLADGELQAYLDEHLDDPDAAEAATGVPDPVLAEMSAARTGAMREIVATIQAEQDVVIRAPIDQCLVVQGGPGTGKTSTVAHMIRALRTHRPTCRIHLAAPTGKAAARLRAALAGSGGSSSGSDRSEWRAAQGVGWGGVCGRSHPGSSWNCFRAS